MRHSTRTIKDQDEALVALAKLVQQGQENPYVVATARKIVRDCPGRDDHCELEKLFDAVKYGDPAVKALEKGYPYRADPKTADWFASADRTLKMCEHGACGGDCDEHAVLLASLAGALGFSTGLRAYGKNRERGFSHVYAVAITPKKMGVPGTRGALAAFLQAIDGFSGHPRGEIIGMDTTVPSSYLGWQPDERSGRFRTAWVSDE